VQISAILAAAARVTTAVTPASLERVTSAARIIECRNTPDQGCFDTQSQRAVKAVTPDASTIRLNSPKPNHGKAASW